MERSKRERSTKKRIQIRVISDDPETVLKVMKLIISSTKLENATITGVYPNRREPGFRGYIVAEVTSSE